MKPTPSVPQNDLPRSWGIFAAVREDAPAMARIYAESFSDTWTAAWIEERLRLPETVAQVARGGDSVVGFVLCQLVLDEGEVLSCAVSPTWRGRGIARALVRAALAAAAGRNAVRMFLEVRDTNAPARAVYTSCGFQTVGRRAGYYREEPGGVPTDAMIMACALSS